ncbi:MAG: hypothetical protein LBK50_01865 [Candidatus Nomurabacteria bacterium]|jgi:hypothetical protein|nr:hypothetical protein [Candidatus Nomurabacteria bacterium]
MISEAYIGNEFDIDDIRSWIECHFRTVGWVLLSEKMNTVHKDGEIFFIKDINLDDFLRVRLWISTVNGDDRTLLIKKVAPWTVRRKNDVYTFGTFRSMKFHVPIRLDRATSSPLEKAYVGYGECWIHTVVRLLE